MKCILKNKELVFEIDTNLYDVETIHRCFYWYQKEFSVEIDLNKNNTASIKMDLLNSGSIENSQKDKICKNIKRDLIDYKLRSIISKETKNIKELIIAKAFSNHD